MASILFIIADLIHNETVELIVGAVSDLMFSVRIGDAAKRVGRRAVFASAFDRVIAQTENKPVLVIVDLACTQAEPIRLIEELRRLGMYVVAFGAHVDAEKLRLAREAGANRVLPRSKFVEDLERIVAGPAESAGPATAVT